MQTSKIKGLFLALAATIAAQTFAQLAPSGEHYAGRATSSFAASIPLELPSPRGALPVPRMPRRVRAGAML